MWTLAKVQMWEEQRTEHSEDDKRLRQEERGAVLRLLTSFWVTDASVNPVIAPRPLLWASRPRTLAPSFLSRSWLQTCGYHMSLDLPDCLIFQDKLKIQIITWIYFYFSDNCAGQIKSLSGPL